ncbi:MAG: hypothetical protein JWO95_2189, partial [Verrucomicrobiales bacterium]|nr:hypothetical protein [Verrucomicrobiales bacterium]
LHFLRARRKTGEIESGSSYQSPFIGGLGGLQILLFEFRQNKIVDRIFWPGFVLNVRNFGTRWGLERPPFLREA